MYHYELFLSRDIDNKGVYFVDTDHQRKDTEQWLSILVSEKTISPDIANAVAFIA